MIDTLIELGLTKNDAAVYSALVEHGPCFVAPIVKAVKKHRQMVYNSLSALERKHLIAVSQKNGKNFYAISDPGRLVTDIKQKEVMAAALVKSIEQKQKHEQEQVEVFAGPTSYERGSADFRRRALEAKEYIVIRSDTEAWFKHARPFFNLHVDELKKLKHAGIDIHIMFYEQERDGALQFLGKYLGDPYTCKVVPDDFKIPESVWLAGDHIYIVTPAADPLVIHIRSKVLAQKYREYFWNTWKKGVILKG